MSFGSGGILGTGLGQGNSDLIGFAANSDFILATVGEELGLAGMMAFLLLYGLIVERGVRTALAARDPFGKLLAIGLSGAFAIQVFVVAGGVMGLIPLTGMTMPFLAYGGSSVIANWALIGILIRISDTARRPAPGPRPVPRRRDDPGGPTVNKPLRRIAIFCGLLVLALLVRDNWLQYVQADELNTHARQPPGPDRAVRHRARQHHRRRQADHRLRRDRTTRDFKYKRTYIDGPMWAPVTGYASQAFDANQIEKLEDGILTGNDDRLFFDRTMAMFTGDKKKGGNVVTTLNGAAQKAAFEGLGNKKGAVAAIDPQTGKILALASTPSYDPSSFAGNSRKDEKAWNDAREGQGQADAQPRAARDLPARLHLQGRHRGRRAGERRGRRTSTRRPTPREPYILPSTTHADGQPRQQPLQERQPEAGARGLLQLRLRASSATTSARTRCWRRPRSSASTSRDRHPGPRRRLASTTRTMDRAGNALSSIGQFNTARHPAPDGHGRRRDRQRRQADEAVHGRPAAKRPTWTSSRRHEPQEMSRPLSQENAQMLQQMMENVVENGTGSNAKIDGVTVGGKTGTAQHGENNSKNPYAWFISYAKTDERLPGRRRRRRRGQRAPTATTSPAAVSPPRSPRP